MMRSTQCLTDILHLASDERLAVLKPGDVRLRIADCRALETDIGVEHADHGVDIPLTS